MGQAPPVLKLPPPLVRLITAIQLSENPPLERRQETLAVRTPTIIQPILHSSRLWGRLATVRARHKHVASERLFHLIARHRDAALILLRCPELLAGHIRSQPERAAS